MVTRLDSAVWEYSINRNQEIWDNVENLLKKNINKIKRTKEKSQFVPDKSSFILKEGYEIELYASEENFPIGNPVAMRFDPKGRLWVSTMPSYPNYYPGDPPMIKLLFWKIWIRMEKLINTKFLPTAFTCLWALN